MKRTVVGIVLLIVLLVLSLVSGMGISRHNETVASRLHAAAQLALAGDLPGAVEAAGEARAVWEKGRKISAAITDHDPLDQVDIGFARLRLYGEVVDPVAFAGVCVELYKQIEALGDANGAEWWNIL